MSGVDRRTYWYWARPSGVSNEAIAIGFRRDRLTPYFSDVEFVSEIRTPHEVHKQENDAYVWVCRGRKNGPGT